MNPDNKLLIYLYSDANFLAVNILESLLSKNCLVNIVTSDTKNWQKKTFYLTNKSRFSIFEESKFDKNQKSNYVIYCEGFLDKRNVYSKVKNFISKTGKENIKTLILLPFEVFDQNENSSIQITDNLSIVYLGDLLGPRIDLESNLLVASSISEILNSRNLTLGVGEIFYPIFISDAVKTITKWLFSFGPYGKELFLLGSQISGSTFWEENQKIVTGISINYDTEIKTRLLPRGYEIKTLEGNIRFSLMETYKWISANSVKPAKPKPLPKVKRKIVYPKFLQPLIITFSVIALVPLLTLAIAAGSFFISYKQFIWGQDDKSQNMLLVAKTFSVLTKEESNLLSYIPILGRVYKETSFAGLLGERTSNIAVSAIPIARTGGEFFNKILGNDIYDPSVLSQSLKSNLGAIYQHLAILQIDVQTQADEGVILANWVQSKFDFERFVNIIIHTESLSDKLPSILGKGGSKTYLLLFQNNMELRPTGGFIGSYGLITFDGGRMSDLTVNDVYSADGQLNGHVEPPTPIKDHLGEANWWLRDSNWDPDFPTSAKRAEWFLDKEVGRKVDGVIAVDLFPVKDILKHTGPIFLSDFNLEVTDNNLYEKTQSEVEDNFFPGTHKKASFLTALSRNLITVVEKLDGVKKAYVLKSFFKSLEERHVQIYLHDEGVQNDLASLWWDGSVQIPECKDNCYPDFVGVVEANLGVNKANYFITRKTDLRINITPTEIDRRLTLTIKNSANPALDLVGKYKVYLRLLTPAGSTILGVNSLVGQNREELSPDIVELKGRQEVGVLVEVLGGQSKSIEFNWRTNVPSGADFDKYNLYVRKQAGIGDEPFSLTVDGRSVYNTTLAKDILWTRKF